MKTILELKLTYDLLDLKDYLQKEKDDYDRIDLFETICDYFECACDIDIRKFDNYEEIIQQHEKLFKETIDNN